jgi:DnaJ-class molecular chaperone
MTFGRRFSTHNKVSEPKDQRCVRCTGTGNVRERGSSIVCKVCAGTGKTITAQRLINSILTRAGTTP